VFSRVAIVLPLALLAAWAMVFAQSPISSEPQEPSPDTIIRINVNLVQIDGVVTDSQGKPVTDLKADDFQILQDGKAQHIRSLPPTPSSWRLRKSPGHPSLTVLSPAG
jgi:hypothetical protein